MTVHAMPVHSELDLDEDIAQQRTMWRLERIGWGLMVLVTLATLAGFTGHGPFSERTAGSTDAGFTVAYNRFERYAAPSLLTVYLGDDVGAETRVRVSQDFLRRVEVLRVDPQPERVELDAEYLTYVFTTTAPGMIVFHYEPARAGHVEIGIGLEGRPLQTLPQFVYP
jgi:hypothetical protein